MFSSSQTVSILFIFPLLCLSSMCYSHTHTHNIRLEIKSSVWYFFSYDVSIPAYITISEQLDIKRGPVTQEELDSVQRKIKNRKATGLEKIPADVWKTRKIDDIQLRDYNAVYNPNPIDRWMKGCILPFPKKGDLGLAKNYRSITLTSIAAKIYNAL